MKNIQNPIAEVFKYLSISITFMFIGYFVGVNFLPQSLVYMAGALLGILIFVLLLMSIFSRKNIIPNKFSMNYVYLFTFIDGALMSPVITCYIGELGSSMVINVLLTSIILFGVLSFISFKDSNSKFLKLGPALFTGLIILLIIHALNMLIFGAKLNLIVSIFSLLLFSGYILFDISLLKARIDLGEIQERDDLSIHVLNLYIDFINIFIDLLDIVHEFI